tara:strand:+ start:394 stop:504 length:111 start_codon:yes stop_codon:yes gene_type:complete
MLASRNTTIISFVSLIIGFESGEAALIDVNKEIIKN